MVEQWTHKPLVVGSNPTLATKTENRQFWRFFGFFPGPLGLVYSRSDLTNVDSASAPPTLPGKTMYASPG